MSPTFVSKGGLWHAAKEQVGGLVYIGTRVIPKSELPKSIVIAGEELKPGQTFIYDGADREALKMLQREGFESGVGEQVLGQDFRHNPEFIQSVRTQGFQTVDEYLKFIGYDDEKDEADFKSRASRTKAHDIGKQVDAINVLAGGKDMANSSGENDVIGGFGEERVRPAREAKKIER